MLKIGKHDVMDQRVLLKIEQGRLNVTQIRFHVENFFEGRLQWDEICKFGNGRIIYEQLYDKIMNCESESLTVDSFLFVEFLLVIKQISRIINELNVKFKGCQFEMENIGQLLRFNIRASEINCGSL